MRRIAVLLGVLLVAGPAAAGSSTAGHQVARPRLMLTDTEPVMLRGAGFKPDEHVRVSVFSGGRSVRRAATSSAAGTFTVRIGSLDVGECTGFSATATGDLGDRAAFKRAPGVCPLP